MTTFLRKSIALALAVTLPAGGLEGCKPKKRASKVQESGSIENRKGYALWTLNLKMTAATPHDQVLECWYYHQNTLAWYRDQPAGSMQALYQNIARTDLQAIKHVNPRPLTRKQIADELAVQTVQVSQLYEQHVRGKPTNPKADLERLYTNEILLSSIETLAVKRASQANFICPPAIAIANALAQSRQAAPDGFKTRVIVDTGLLSNGDEVKGPSAAKEASFSLNSPLVKGGTEVVEAVAKEVAQSGMTTKFFNAILNSSKNVVDNSFGVAAKFFGVDGANLLAQNASKNASKITKELAENTGSLLKVPVKGVRNPKFSVMPKVDPKDVLKPRAAIRPGDVLNDGVVIRQGRPMQLMLNGSAEVTEAASKAGPKAVDGAIEHISKINANKLDFGTVSAQKLQSPASAVRGEFTNDELAVVVEKWGESTALRQYFEALNDKALRTKYYKLNSLVGNRKEWKAWKATNLDKPNRDPFDDPKVREIFDDLMDSMKGKTSRVPAIPTAAKNVDVPPPGAKGNAGGQAGQGTQPGQPGQPDQPLPNNEPGALARLEDVAPKNTPLDENLKSNQQARKDAFPEEQAIPKNNTTANRDVPTNEEPLTPITNHNKPPVVDELPSTGNPANPTTPQVANPTDPATGKAKQGLLGRSWKWTKRATTVAAWTIIPSYVAWQALGPGAQQPPAEVTFSSTDDVPWMNAEQEIATEGKTAGSAEELRAELEKLAGSMGVPLQTILDNGLAAQRKQLACGLSTNLGMCFPISICVSSLLSTQDASACLSRECNDDDLNASAAAPACQ